MSIHAIQKTIEFIKQAAGIILTPEKAYFVEARLAPVLREENIANLDDLLRKAEGGDRRLQQRMIDALTTNETFFFRDRQPFDHFRDVIMPELHQRRAPERTIRIWCAACSSGQEPFSLVMLLDEMRAKIGNRQVEIVATDISEGILSKAKAGLFNQFEVQRGLPTKLLLQYFQKQGDNWKISDDVVRRVNFQKFNLMDDPRGLGTFDAIFCRNVLIYFDRPTRSKVFDKLASRLAPDGFLLLGGAESTFGVTERFVSHSKERMLLVPAPVQKPELRVAGA
jgi:chemotaxis protein methyltransferase CheR